MIVSFPSAFCYFFGYETTKAFVRKNYGDRINENIINFLGGCGAEIFANTVR